MRSGVALRVRIQAGLNWCSFGGRPGPTRYSSSEVSVCKSCRSAFRTRRSGDADDFFIFCILLHREAICQSDYRLRISQSREGAVGRRCTSVICRRTLRERSYIVLRYRLIPSKNIKSSAFGDRRLRAAIGLRARRRRLNPFPVPQADRLPSSRGAALQCPCASCAPSRLQISSCLASTAQFARRVRV